MVALQGLPAPRAQLAAQVQVAEQPAQPARVELTEMQDRQVRPGLQDLLVLQEQQVPMAVQEQPAQQVPQVQREPA